MTDSMLLPPSDEFDVSAAGVPTLTGAVATITGFEVVEKEGKGTLHEVTFEIEGLGFPLTKGYWFIHTNEKAVQAGRGQLKRISVAATGSPKYSTTSLLGRKVMVDVREDAAGFAEIRNIKALPNA